MKAAIAGVDRASAFAGRRKDQTEDPEYEEQDRRRESPRSQVEVALHGRSAGSIRHVPYELSDASVQRRIAPRPQGARRQDGARRATSTPHRCFHPGWSGRRSEEKECARPRSGAEVGDRRRRWCRPRRTFPQSSPNRRSAGGGGSASAAGGRSLYSRPVHTFRGGHGPPRSRPRAEGAHRSSSRRAGLRALRDRPSSAGSDRRRSRPADPYDR